MKKLILSLFLISAIISCNKNEKTAPNTNTEISNTTPDSTTVTTNKKALKEITSEELTQLIASKKNDTIYVTNFFATWCGPCMKEIPHFAEKIEKTKGQAIKFTFVSVDAKEEWNTTVSDFADEYNLRKNIVLFDASMITPDFYTKITKTWDGGSIPFTIIKKGDKEIENLGFLSKEDLETKLNSLK